MQRRNIVVNGKSASVYGIRQPDGTDGITTDVGKPFSVRVVNKINEPSLIHWHGMTPALAAGRRTRCFRTCHIARGQRRL